MKIKNKHLPNRELGILNSETDFFGHIDKGNAIVSFLNSNIDDLGQMNMIALYGKWGSGKSTLMKHIGSELEKGNYRSLYFPAWEFEKDENLPLSLTHFIINETGVNKEKIVNAFLKNAGEVLKSIGKGVSVETEFLKFDMEKVIKSEEEYYENEARKNESKYTKTRDFKGEFKTIEKSIIKKVGKKKIIIFIDDLDRCEPENVLTLISSIKLFFTYVENVIFMFGCDKDAIAKAVQHKYGEVINADEYLEKVIDVSFSMPNDISIHKLLNHYFPGETVVNNDSKNNSLFLQNFFKAINFINPRQLKKVLNKYEIICDFKEQATLSPIYRDLIPNIIINQRGDLMETVFTLYFIVLNEFYPETFSELIDFEAKLLPYVGSHIITSRNKSPSTNHISLRQGKQHLQSQTTLNDLEISFNEIIRKVNERGIDYKNDRFNFFLTIFTPSINTDQIDIRANGIDFIEQFPKKGNSQGNIMTLNFCEFLAKNQDNVLSIKSEYKVINFFRMCQVLL